MTTSSSTPWSGWSSWRDGGKGDRMANVEIDDDILRQLESEAASRGLPDARHVVNRVLRLWLHTAGVSRMEAVYDRTLLSREMTGNADDDAEAVYEVALREVGYANTPRKRVYIRRYLRDIQGRQSDGRTITFPARGAAFVRDTILPWVAQSLTDIDVAHRAEVSANRRRGQERRAALSPDQKAAADEARCSYTALYGKEAWQHARSQATRHRARAERRGLSEHFTAVEWLDLAAAADFKCAWCGGEGAALTTHHLRALASGGTNTIANLALICKSCHDAIPVQAEDGAEAWLAAETRKMSLFRVGDTVKRAWGSGTQRTDRGEIIAVIPPVRGDGPLWCLRRSLTHQGEGAGELVIPDHLWSQQTQAGYVQTRFKVRWTWRTRGKPYEEEYTSDRVGSIVPAEEAAREG
jgi:5-methylcytosine-specific restriction endonuclease McrA